MIKKELKKKKYSILRKKVVWCLAGLVLILIALIFLSHLNKLNIKDVEISGNKVAEREEIKNLVLNEISGKHFFLLPKSNIFIYPKSKIKTDLAERFKILKDISLNVGESLILEVKVRERTPTYLWCSAEEHCSFMDEDGVVFSEAPQFSSGVYFKFYGPIEEKYFPSFIFFKEALGTMEIKPVALFVSDNEFKFLLSPRSATSTKPEILLNSETEFEKAAENLQSALGTEPLATDFKKKYSRLEYIDLRFGNKVYYRFQ